MSLYAEQRGNAGPWIVFVHGFACDHSDWAHQVDSLADAHRCLALDLPGHGQSATVASSFTMPDLAAQALSVLKDHEVDQAVLVGHSMGTRVVAEMALQAPAVAAGLVFVDGSQLGHGDPAVAQSTIRGLIDQLGYDHVMRVNFAAMFNDAAHPDCARIVARAQALPEPIGRALWEALVGYDAGELEQRYAQLSTPLTIVQSSTVEVGGRRRSLSAGETETPYLNDMRRLIPHAQIRLAPNVGHFIQIEEPQLVVDAVVETNRQTRGHMQ